MKIYFKNTIIYTIGALLLFSGTFLSVSAFHSWVGPVDLDYSDVPSDNAQHWYHETNNTVITFIDSTTDPEWSPLIRQYADEWSKAIGITVVVEQDSIFSRIGIFFGSNKCPLEEGKIRICNGDLEGMDSKGAITLGLARFFITGEENHAQYGRLTFNNNADVDRFYDRSDNSQEKREFEGKTATYREFNTAHTVCHEMGHMLGLGHNDAVSSSTPTYSCTDYPRSPLDAMHPNLHDYNELEEIYKHLDEGGVGSDTASSASGLGNKGKEGDGIGLRCEIEVIPGMFKVNYIAVGELEGVDTAISSHLTSTDGDNIEGRELTLSKSDLTKIWTWFEGLSDSDEDSYVLSANIDGVVYDMANTGGDKYSFFKIASALYGTCEDWKIDKSEFSLPANTNVVTMEEFRARFEELDAALAPYVEGTNF